MDEQVSQELLDRIEKHHPYLRSMSLQVRRGETWKHVRAGARTFAEQPPSIGAYDLCCLLERAAQDDAEASDVASPRYRVRLRCRQDDREYTRYAKVGGTPDDVDASDEEPEDGEAKQLRQAIDQNVATVFKSVDAVLESVKAFADTAAVFNAVVAAAGQQYASQANSKVELLRVQLAIEQQRQQHDAKMAQLDRGFGAIAGPIGRIGDEIAANVIEFGKGRRRGSNGR